MAGIGVIMVISIGFEIGHLSGSRTVDRPT